jgi:L-fuculose-phosphate aldolase
MIVHGPTADQALTNAVVLETLCRQYLLARSAGVVRLLNADEMRAAQQRYQTYGQPARTTTRCS